MCTVFVWTGILAKRERLLIQEDVDKLKSTKQCPSSDLCKANLTEADMRETCLFKATLEGAKLINASLIRAKWVLDPILLIIVLFLSNAYPKTLASCGRVRLQL